MKKKIAKCALLLVFMIIVILAIFNTYKWIVCGEQYIKISTSNKAYTNSDLYVSIIAQDKGVDLETETKIKLLNSDGKKVKDAIVSYDGSNAKISIPEIEAGNYFIEAKVSSKAGKDTIQKEIYITDGNQENVTITLDKGIYKPGDTVNFRALLTNKENDNPIIKDVNVCIYDGNDNKVYNENVKTSEYGILSGNFTLANEVNSGIYKIVIKTNTNETTKSFKVNPYITPKYEVKINFDKQNYLVGDTATININAKYFFGEPVTKAKYTVYINDKSYQTITADEQGNASVKYKIEDAKSYSVKVEATDSSNYFVEGTNTFVAGTDIFEVELLSEYGSLVAGEKNDIYVFTSNPDGSPVKAYITVSSDYYTKQIATDENGIGKFSIDIDTVQTNNYNYYKNNKTTKSFKINAVNMNGEKVQKDISLSVETKNLLVSTDKVKYEQGEDIKINISSALENTKNIYFFKNDKLIKMLSTDSSDTNVNLDDVYGIIDIYVTQKGNNQNSYYYSNSNYYNTNSYKKTIFVKPTKELNININTDKQEYKPGENITISFGTTDENNNNIDSALLVSMLDNSILSLADNDLSIDNIKLALSDLSFSDELDATTLYSCIVDDKSEQTMMALLLKQSNRDMDVSESSMYNYEEEAKSAVISILSIVAIVLTVIIYLCVRFNKFRNFMKHAINTIIYTLTVVILSVCIIEEYFWRTNDYSWWIFSFTVVVCLATYIAWVSKLNKKIFRTSISIILSYIIFMVALVLIEVFEVAGAIILLIIALLVLALAILSKINEVKKLKFDKFIRKISKEVLYICKYAGALIVSIIIGNIVQAITDISGIIIPVGIVSIYFFNYLFNKLGKEETSYEYDYIEKKPFSFYIIIALAVLGLLTVGYFVISALTSFSGSLDSSMPQTSINSGTGGLNPGTITPSDIIGSVDSATSNSSSGGLSDIFESASDFISSGTSKGEASTTTPSNNTPTTETVVDDNIRNVFLESMCFIPELVTTNGSAKLDLKLSDNITTWTIQTVGNTKDGKIGYGMLDTVKVFKEFFVDFELPKNLVETDKVSIPVTVYNYTNSPLNTTLKVKEDEWFTLRGNNNISITVEAESTKMVYVPITILKNGNYKFRVEATNNSLTDIVEKELNISPKGYKIEKVVSTGSLESDVSEDILILEDIVENTASAKVKIYASTMAQSIEGMENIFRMPTGCFEQISSSLYPNILALKYLEDNGIVNEELKTKAISYISSGYQKLLTYEVKGESGGYSLYGNSPAETVLTAYGLMELTDLKEVYNVDETVLNKMTNFLYKKQNSNGSFTITGNHVGGAGSRETLALNAYITWALSESDPKNEKLSKSIDYLKGKIDDVDDNYTLALIANSLANVEDKEVNNVINRLVNNINLDGNNAYITSNIKDYYGSRSNSQTIQTVALTSMALSKTSNNMSTNKLLINYLISKKDSRGTWYSTQATILSLKALNELNEKNKLDNQTIIVKVNSDEQKIEIKDNPLEFYELSFGNLGKENKLNIDIEKGSAYYEVVEEYYIPYEKVNTSEDEIEVTVETNNNLKVNEILDTKVKVINKSKDDIYNGMVTITIPQGFTVVEESLMLLESKGIIEKYETSYTSVNIYLRDFEISQIVDLNIKFRASYPVEITGLAIRAYDYYNPEVEGKTMPIQIVVTD